MEFIQGRVWTVVSSQKCVASQYGWWEWLGGSSQCSFEERHFVWEEILTCGGEAQKNMCMSDVGERKGKKEQYVIIQEINPQKSNRREKHCSPALLCVTDRTCIVE
jgi:hypothetical protein